jgi:hypothetical protein
MLIEVRVETIAGKPRFFPASDVAQTLAKLAGSEDLAPAVLDAAAHHLAAEVVVVAGNSEAAAEALAAFMVPVTLH